MMSSIQSEKKISLWWFILLIIFIVLSPILVYFFIIENNFPSKASNDAWTSFWGSYLGGISTLIAVFITVKQTRDIQNENKNIQERITKNEEKLLLQNSRTFIEEALIVCEYNLNSSFRNTLKGNKIIITPEYNFIEKLINRDTEILNQKCYEIYYNRCNIINMNQLYSNIHSLEVHKNYIFKVIKNIGNNPMYNVKISVTGKWFSQGRILNEDTIVFNIKYIDGKDSIVLPLFKVNEDIILEQLNASKTVIEYHTGMFGLKEKIILNLEYNVRNNIIKESIKVNLIDEDLLNYEYEFMEYKIIE